VNAQSQRGFNALMAAAQNGWKDIVQLLLSNGAKSDLQTTDGSTALIAASAKGYDEIVRLLGQHDPSLVHRRFRVDCTALMTAVTKGFVGVVRELLLLGCDVDAANKDSWTALLLAAHRGFLRITRLLLQNKAVVDCNTPIGFTPLMYAIRNAYKDVVVELLDHGAMVNHFELDAFNKEVVTQQMPLVYGYISPLMLAVISGNRTIIELLLDRLADLHLDLSHLMVHCKSSSGGSSSMNDATFIYSHCGTVLLLAIHQGDPSLVELLLQHEAEMKQRVESGVAALTAGLSPLSIARYKEQWVLDDRNSLGAGVLQVAADRGDPALFLLLLRRGAYFDRCSFSYWCILARFYCSLVYRCRLVLLARIFLALLIRCVRVPLRGVEQSVGCKVKRD
jgi:ankyrin repeat protein